MWQVLSLSEGICEIQKPSLRIRVPEMDLDTILRQYKVIGKGLELGAPHNIGGMAFGWTRLRFFGPG